jgi:hypothetical protein
MYGLREGFPTRVYCSFDSLSTLGDFPGLLTNCISGRIPDFGAAFPEVGGAVDSFSPNQQTSFPAGSGSEQQPLRFIQPFLQVYFSCREYRFNGDINGLSSCRSVAPCRHTPARNLDITISGANFAIEVPQVRCPDSRRPTVALSPSL